MALVLIRYFYCSQIANGVEITRHQLPEIRAIYDDLIDRMEIGYEPRLYLVNGNGSVNAFAAKCQVRRAYVVIYSDIVDIAYELGDFDGVKFVLAHELGHIKCERVAIWRSAVSVVLIMTYLQKPSGRSGPTVEITNREDEVLAAVCEGLTNVEIADRLHISASTVKGHIANLMAKTDSSNRVKLVIWAFRNRTDSW